MTRAYKIELSYDGITKLLNLPLGTRVKEVIISSDNLQTVNFVIHTDSDQITEKSPGDMLETKQPLFMLYEPAEDNYYFKVSHPYLEKSNA